jgi:hypothetical protein
MKTFEQKYTITIVTKILKSESAAAIAGIPYTTACSPNKIALPGADAFASNIVQMQLLFCQEKRATVNRFS